MYKPTLALSLLLLASCGGDKSNITVVTYNVGLAIGFVPGAVERADAASAAVGALEADVICLQEVWTAEHVTAMKAGTAERYTDSYFPDPQQIVHTDPSCTVEDVGDLLSCMDEDCADACVDELPTCLFSNCPIDFLNLEKDCNRCVQANVGASTEEVLAACTEGGVEYAYGASFGTGILSVYPLIDTEELVFESTSNRRSVLHAVVDHPKGEVDVYCTHLTADLTPIPYPRDESYPTQSWEEEQKVQFEELITFMGEGKTGRTILLGDLNAGPETKGADPEFANHYDMIVDAGYVAPFVDDEGSCTFCPDNGISSVDSDATGKLIDHIFFKGFDGEFESSRVLDQTVDVETCGEVIDGAHSDHYGVQVTTSL